MKKFRFAPFAFAFAIAAAFTSVAKEEVRTADNPTLNNQARFVQLTTPQACNQILCSNDPAQPICVQGVANYYTTKQGTVCTALSITHTRQKI